MLGNRLKLPEIVLDALGSMGVDGNRLGCLGIDGNRLGCLGTTWNHLGCLEIDGNHLGCLGSLYGKFFSLSFLFFYF